MPFHCSLLASGMTDFSDPVNRNIVYVVDSKPKNSQLSQGPLDTLRQESGDPHVCQLHSKKSALWPPAWQPGWSDNTAHKLTKSKADARLCRAACAAEKISRCTTSGDVWGEGTGGELSGP